MVNWLNEHLMQANPTKFPSTTEDNPLGLTGGIDAFDCLKLLGADIDKDLNFSTHISRLCKKQVNNFRFLGDFQIY